jgi:hypothetical protein
VEEKFSREGRSKKGLAMKNGVEGKLLKDVSRVMNVIGGVGLWTWWSARGRGGKDVHGRLSDVCLKVVIG